MCVIRRTVLNSFITQFKYNFIYSLKRFFLFFQTVFFIYVYLSKNDFYIKILDIIIKFE